MQHPGISQAQIQVPGPLLKSPRRTGIDGNMSPILCQLVWYPEPEPGRGSDRLRYGRAGA